MKKNLFYTAIAALLMGASFCSCSEKESSGPDDNGGNIPAGENLMDGPYSIKFKLNEYGDKIEYLIFTSDGAEKAKLRMDHMYDSEYYSGEGGYEGGEASTPIPYVYHSIDIDCWDYGYSYSNWGNKGEWEDSDWARNTINNELAEMKLDPKYYVKAGFEKKGKITVLGKELDLYEGTSDMLKDFIWVGYHHIGDSYKTMKFAYDGGIVMYMAKDDNVVIEAVAVTTKVPAEAFTKKIDVTWIR